MPSGPSVSSTQPHRYSVSHGDKSVNIGHPEKAHDSGSVTYVLSGHYDIYYDMCSDSFAFLVQILFVTRLSISNLRPPGEHFPDHGGSSPSTSVLDTWFRQRVAVTLQRAQARANHARTAPLEASSSSLSPLPSRAIISAGDLMAIAGFS